MSLTKRAGSILRDAVSKGDVPAVAAVSTNREATLDEGGFGKRVQGAGFGCGIWNSA